MLIAVFAFSFSFHWMFFAGKVLLALFIAFTLLDILLLVVRSSHVSASRIVQPILSLGNSQVVKIKVMNNSDSKLCIDIIDELPYQLQRRDFKISIEINKLQELDLSYNIRPVKRGIYNFGLINLILKSEIKLCNYRLISGSEAEVSVYPSIIDMRELELSAFNTLVHSGGVRKIRRIGHSYVFEQIRDYVNGDEFRTVNWRATGRRGKLMVNQYEDERSQQIICIIDQNRSMQLPFNKLSLLDYSINATLAISNIALKKEDKAGVIMFSHQSVNFVKPDKRKTQLKKILENLYASKETQLEPNFELLYSSIRSGIKQRSLFFLFTNFETSYALERALPILRRLSKFHLLVVVFFKNAGIEEMSVAEANNLEEIYIQSLATQSLSKKIQLIQILKQHGIQSILCKPEDLSIEVANKYLELKARGLI